jgi:hypothetical protein
MNLSVDVKETVAAVTALHATLKAAFVPPHIVLQLMHQLFYALNAQLVGELLRRPDLCTCKRGLALKMAASQFEAFTSLEPLLGPVQCVGAFFFFSFLLLLVLVAHPLLRGRLDGVVEAANLLVLDKATITDAELRALFSHVSPTHLLQLLRSFVPDQLSPNRVPAQLLTSAEDMARRAPPVSQYPDPYYFLSSPEDNGPALR